MRYVFTEDFGLRKAGDYIEIPDDATVSPSYLEPAPEEPPADDAPAPVAEEPAAEEPAENTKKGKG